jgi:predicted DsbA family dithiol-disulfide isomerase
MSSLSIDSSKIDSCMTADAEALYNTDTAAAKQLGITGSPSFTINGAKVQVNRTPEAIKKAICDAFTTAPSECSQNLSSTAASAGFGAGASTAAASCG